MSDGTRAFLESVAANEPFGVPEGEDNTWLGVMSPFSPSTEPVSWGEERYRAEATHSIPKIMPSLMDALKDVNELYWETPQGRETATRLNFIGRGARALGQSPPGRLLSDFANEGLGALSEYESSYMLPLTVGAEALRGEASTLGSVLGGEEYEFELGDVTGNQFVDFFLSAGLDPLNFIPGGGLGFVSPRLISRLRGRGVGKAGDDLVEFANANAGRDPDEVFEEGLRRLAESQPQGSLVKIPGSDEWNLSTPDFNLTIVRADKTPDLKTSPGRTWYINTLESYTSTGNPKFIDGVDALTRLADSTGITLWTAPEAFGAAPLSTDQLYKMYSKIGFEIDSSANELMVRAPMPLDEAARVSEFDARFGNFANYDVARRAKLDFAEGTPNSLTTQIEETYQQYFEGIRLRDGEVFEFNQLATAVDDLSWEFAENFDNYRDAFIAAGGGDSGRDVVRELLEDFSYASAQELTGYPQLLDSAAQGFADLFPARAARAVDEVVPDASGLSAFANQATLDAIPAGQADNVAAASPAIEVPQEVAAQPRKSWYQVITARRSDLVLKRGMGGESWYQLAQPDGSNRVMRGRPIEYEELPEQLYHVTTNPRGIEQSGNIKVSGGGDEGLGGSSGTGAVSLTVSPEIASTIQRDMQIFAGLKTLDSPEKVQDYFVNLLSSENARQKDIDSFVEEMTSKLSDGYHTPVSVAKHMFTRYSHERRYWGGPRSSVIIGDPDSSYWRNIKPEDIQILTISRNQIPSEALAWDYDLGRGGLEEVQIFGDIPLR